MKNDMRLIDANALVEKFKNAGLGEHGLIEKIFADGVYAVIDSAPTIDAVQVVRCNDCVLHGHCTVEDTFRMVRLYDGYCRCGKRREA